MVKTKQEFHWTRLLLRYRDWRTVAYTPVSWVALSIIFYIKDK